MDDKQVEFFVNTIDKIRDNQNFIQNMCISYRHDYGLLSDSDRRLVELQCKEWLRSLSNNFIEKNIIEL